MGEIERGAVMKIEHLKKITDGQFRRVVGVKRKTFEKMVELLEAAQIKKKAKGGRNNKLSVSNMLLMALEYLREYRTYASIGVSYGLSESNAYQTIRWVENTLISCGEFNLPGKKALLKSDHEFEIILIDATESPIERPKKNNADSILAKRKNIP
jgi:Helix-turn-helix of DDE superfamily endonuclease